MPRRSLECVQTVQRWQERRHDRECAVYFCHA
jgi:hypothetical protein